MRSKYIFFAICSSILASGCETTPKVEYRTIASPSDMAGMADSFYLRKTALEISGSKKKSKDSAGNELIETAISIKPLVKEDAGTRYAIGGNHGLFSTTRVNLTKIENTNLIQSVGTETTDTTKNTIEQAGGVIAKLISLASVFGAAPQTPCIKEAKGKKIFELDPSKTSETFDGDRPGCIQVTYGDAPKEAILASEIPTRSNTSFYYYSACRDAKVVIQQSNTETVTETIKISDPSLLQYVQLPSKGKVKHHSVCGVSVVTEAATNTNPADIVGALEAQGKAIKEALDAAKK